MSDQEEKCTKNEIVDLELLFLPRVVLGLGFPICHPVSSIKKNPCMSCVSSLHIFFLHCLKTHTAQGVPCDW